VELITPNGVVVVVVAVYGAMHVFTWVPVGQVAAPGAVYA
jgi:hypothetical protein